MAIVKCKECGHDVSDKAAKCPNCGAPVEVPAMIENDSKQASKGNKKALVGIIIAVAVLVIVGVIILVVHGAGNGNSDYAFNENYFENYSASKKEQEIQALKDDRSTMYDLFDNAMTAFSANAGNLSSADCDDLNITFTLKKNSIDVEGVSCAEKICQDFKSYASLSSGYDFVKDMDSKAGKNIGYITITLSAETGSKLEAYSNSGKLLFQYNY